MKKYFVLILVVIIAVLSVMSVCYAAPFNRYYDQDGNRYWCNSDVDGCWVTGKNGEKEYIMFWSEASRDKTMGEGSNAPIGIAYHSSEMPLMAPPTAIPLITITPPPVTETPVTATPETTPECSTNDQCGTGKECKEGKCVDVEDPCANVTCAVYETCELGQCKKTACSDADKAGLPNCGEYDWNEEDGCTCKVCSEQARYDCSQTSNSEFNDDNCICECQLSQDDCGDKALNSDTCSCSRCPLLHKQHCESSGKIYNVSGCQCI